MNSWAGGHLFCNCNILHRWLYYILNVLGVCNVFLTAKYLKLSTFNKTLLLIGCPALQILSHLSIKGCVEISNFLNQILTIPRDADKATSRPAVAPHFRGMPEFQQLRGGDRRSSESFSNCRCLRVGSGSYKPSVRNVRNCECFFRGFM